MCCGTDHKACPHCSEDDCIVNKDIRVHDQPNNSRLGRFTVYGAFGYCIQQRLAERMDLLSDWEEKESKESVRPREQYELATVHS